MKSIWDSSWHIVSARYVETIMIYSLLGDGSTGMGLGSSVVGTAEVDRTEIGSSGESKQEVEQSTEVE